MPLNHFLLRRCVFNRYLMFRVTLSVDLIRLVTLFDCACFYLLSSCDFVTISLVNLSEHSTGVLVYHFLNIIVLGYWRKVFLFLIRGRSLLISNVSSFSTGLVFLLVLVNVFFFFTQMFLVSIDQLK